MKWWGCFGNPGRWRIGTYPLSGLAAAHAADSHHALQSHHASQSHLAPQSHYAPQSHHAPVVSCFLASSGTLTPHWTAQDLVQGLIAWSSFGGNIGDVGSRDLLKAPGTDFQKQESLPHVCYTHCKEEGPSSRFTPACISCLPARCLTTLPAVTLLTGAQ